MTDPEWTREPDRKHWIDSTTNLDCLIVRGPSGALCGYVGVSPSHPAYNKHYDSVEAEVHGGLTFSGPCHGKICHDESSETVASTDVWWLGFDCAHSGDMMPGFDYLPGKYRNLAYVEDQCRSLAKQLKDLESR